MKFCSILAVVLCLAMGSETALADAHTQVIFERVTSVTRGKALAFSSVKITGQARLTGSDNQSRAMSVIIYSSATEPTVVASDLTIVASCYQAGLLAVTNGTKYPFLASFVTGQAFAHAALGRQAASTIPSYVNVVLSRESDVMIFDIAGINLFSCSTGVPTY